MTFVKRPLPSSNTLGERLRQLRQEAGLSVNDLGRRIQVAPKYLMAIEEGRYRELPGLVYARQFVRRYAAGLQTDVDYALSLFDREYAIVRGGGLGERPLLTPRAKTDFPWWRRHLRLLAASIITLGLLAYLGIQVVRLYTPPPLTIIQPAGDVMTKDASITVSGFTVADARVTINGQDIAVTNNGQFSEQVDLRAGLNALRISAVKKHSGPRVVVRQVLVE